MVQANIISLAAGVLPEFGPVEIIEAAASAKFDAVGLWVDLEGWTTQTTRDVKSALVQNGLPLLDVEVVWIKPDTSLDDHLRSLEIGIELGAQNLLCVSSDPDAGATAAKLSALCEQSVGSNMRIALEFGIFTEVKNLTMAYSITERVNHPKISILIDPIHVDRSGTRVEEIARLPDDLLPYAQFCDAPAARPDPMDFNAVITDAIDLRQQCGQGALPLMDIHAALPKGIPLSIELRSKVLRDSFPDASERAGQVAVHTRRWLESLP